MATTSKASSKPVVEELLETYKRIGIPPEFSPAQSKVLVATWRAVAEGVPVTPERIAGIAADSGMSTDEAVEFLTWMSEKDDAGNILGVMGLTQTGWPPAKFTVDEHELHAWCALDTFFLPLMLNKTADVEVPVATGGSIRLRIGPERVESVEPTGAVMTTVVPGISNTERLELAEEIWNIFCHHSLYFRSREEADAFTAGKDLEIIVLSIEDAYEVASRAFAGLREYAR
ncbi:MAG: hypothetical protein IIA54_01610 [Chloroflexi bacterium]|nr:hypothetical protein [Chloroflexota bacterium]